MPSPSVMVRVLGDLTGLSKSFTDAGTKGNAAAKGMHEAFDGMLGALNKTGVLGPFGDALDSIDQAISSVSLHAKDIGPAMMGVGGALVGIGSGLSALGSKDQAAHQQLQAAVAATGKSYDDYADKVEAAIKHQETFGNSASQTQDALRILTQATNDPAKALEILNTASDLATAKHESLTTAASQLGKTYNGNTRILKEFGIQTTSTGNVQKALTTATSQSEKADKTLAAAKQHLADVEAIDAGRKSLTAAQAITLRDAQQKVVDATDAAQVAHGKLVTAQDNVRNSGAKATDTINALGDKLKGQASAAADTFGGKLKDIKTRVEDAAAAFGAKYGPAITAAGGVMAGLGGTITATQGIISAFTKTQEAAQGATKAVAAAEDVEAVSSWAALGPILLIIAAVAALAAVGYVIYRNWSTIWGAIKAVIKDVWDWIQGNWPLLLGILLGPIALAAALIYKYWDDILAGLKVVWNELKNIGSDVWNGILDAVKVVWNWIQGNWPLLLGILLGPIALAAALIYKYWDYILVGIQYVWDWIKSAWNTVYDDLVKPFGRFIGWVAGLPGAIVAIFAGALNWLEKTGSDILLGLWNGLSGLWARLWGWLSAIPGAIIGTYAAALGWLYQAGVNILQGLWSGLVWLWDHLWGWLSAIPGAIIGTYGAALGWLYQAGLNILQGLWNGLVWLWNHLWAWFSTIPATIIGLFATAIGWLYQEGLNILQGLWNGLYNTWVKLWGWFSGIWAALTGYFHGCVTWLTGAGEQLINGLLSGMTNIFKDIGNWIHNNIYDPLVKAIKGAFGISSPSTVMIGLGEQLLAGLVKGFTPGNLADMAKNIFGGLPAALAALIGKGLVSVAKIPGDVLRSLGSALGSVGSFLGGLFGGGGGGGNVSSWIQTAMSILGTPSYWAGPLATIIQHESGGNPNAINLTDINAQRGDPSRGLMQTIGSTFAAYALPGFNKNIFDPVSNIIAGIRYIQARYGDILRVPGIANLMRGGSYVGYDSGGILPPGVTMAVNSTGHNEYVSTSPPRGGPAVVIQSAHFATEVDVDAFMRRAAWVARTQAV